MVNTISAIDAYNGYGDFSIGYFFANKYGCVPSTADITVEVGKEKRRVEKVLASLGLDPDTFKTVYGNWRTGNHIDGQKKDSLKYTVLASRTSAIVMIVYSYSESATVEFYFDGGDADLKMWVFGQVDKMRKAFGKIEKPVFRILIKSNGEYDTKEVDIQPAETDLTGNYNDSLLEVDKIIQKSVETNQSGLILLHGIPGTGKTTYIKTLLTRNSEEKFIFIPNDFVDEMLKPSFITFLISQKNSTLVIEDAESVIMAREQAQNKSVVSTILQITDGLFSDFLNIKVICTFNTDVSKIDKALFRKGRMIAFYEFGELEEAKAMALLGVDSADDLPKVRTLAELYNHKERSFEEATSRKKIGFGG